LRHIVGVGGYSASPQCQQNLFSTLLVPPHFRQMTTCLVGFFKGLSVWKMHCTTAKPKAKPKQAERNSLTANLTNYISVKTFDLQGFKDCFAKC
jgi:hypothetical protein